MCAAEERSASSFVKSARTLRLFITKLARTNPSIYNYAQMQICISVYTGMDVYGRTCAQPKNGACCVSLNRRGLSVDFVIS